MPIPEIEEFAKILVQQVRDAAIRDCDILLQPNAASPRARRWRQTGVESIKGFIPDIVDETVFCLLRAIDQGLLRVKFTSSNGREIDLTEEGLGELAGWYVGGGGWREMFAEERHVDDFAEKL